MHRSGERNAFAHCWRHVKFRNSLLSCLVKHTGEHSIRKYSPFCRVAFLLIPAASSNLPRRRDFLSGKGEHVDHKRRFRKTPPPPPPVLRCGSMRIVHSANTAQPRPVVLPFFLKFARRGRSCVSCLLSSQSSNLHLLPEFFAVPFIVSMKSPEKRVPAYGE